MRRFYARLDDVYCLGSETTYKDGRERLVAVPGSWDGPQTSPWAIAA